MDNCYSDATFWMYVATWIVSGLGAWLFIWWMIKAGSASSVYIYVTLLLIGQWVSSGLAGWARIIYWKVGLLEYRLFLESNWWVLRTSITLVALIAIVTHMAHRAFFQRKN